MYKLLFIIIDIMDNILFRLKDLPHGMMVHLRCRFTPAADEIVTGQLADRGHLSD